MIGLLIQVILVLFPMLTGRSVLMVLSLDTIDGIRALLSEWLSLFLVMAFLILCWAGWSRPKIRVVLLAASCALLTYTWPIHMPW